MSSDQSRTPFLRPVFRIASRSQNVLQGQLLTLKDILGVTDLETSIKASIAPSFSNQYIHELKQIDSAIKDATTYINNVNQQKIYAPQRFIESLKDFLRKWDDTFKLKLYESYHKSWSKHKINFIESIIRKPLTEELTVLYDNQQSFEVIFIYFFFYILKDYLNELFPLSRRTFNDLFQTPSQKMMDMTLFPDLKISKYKKDLPMEAFIKEKLDTELSKKSPDDISTFYNKTFGEFSIYQLKSYNTKNNEFVSDTFVDEMVNIFTTWGIRASYLASWKEHKRDYTKQLTGINSENTNFAKIERRHYTQANYIYFFLGVFLDLLESKYPVYIHGKMVTIPIKYTYLPQIDFDGKFLGIFLNNLKISDSDFTLENLDSAVARTPPPLTGGKRSRKYKKRSVTSKTRRRSKKKSRRSKKKSRLSKKKSRKISSKKRKH